MGRGVSSGGGSSSLGYLFGSNEPPKTAEAPKAPAVQHQPLPQPNQPSESVSYNKSSASATSVSRKSQNLDADGELNRNNNIHHRAAGQNSSNFVKDRPSTKVHSAPGGGSSLGYLFGGGE